MRSLSFFKPLYVLEREIESFIRSMATMEFPLNVLLCM